MNDKTCLNTTSGPLYDVTLADPPWKYDHCLSKSRRIENQYPTMSIKEICEYPVKPNKNAVLYLWSTAPKLLDALGVMQCWGFTYKTQMVWDKQIIGPGYWFRGQHEILLVGTRGKFSPPPPGTRISSVWDERRGKHSAKPAGIRKCIEAWFPDARRIELFARERVEGWDAEGLEL